MREKHSIEITWKIELADEFLMTDYLYAHHHSLIHIHARDIVLNGEYRGNATLTHTLASRGRVKKRQNTGPTSN